MSTGTRSRFRIWWQCKLDSTLACVFGAHRSCEGCHCECHWNLVCAPTPGVEESPE